VPRLKTVLATDVNLRRLSREDQLAVTFTPEALERAEKLEMLCATLQFALPGVPSIYYGDEQGMEGVGDPFNRGPFHEGSKTLHDFYMRLCKLRNSVDALSTGKVEFQTVNSDVLLVLRYITDGRDIFGEESENSVWLCVINRRETPCPYTAELKCAGLDVYTGTAAPLSGEFIKIQ
jgi:4-alpha-glucanotransferase